MKAELAELDARVRDLIRDSVVRDHVNDIVLEADRDDEGTDFLRVILEVKQLDGVNDADLEALVESIEKVIGDLDERFPSVRFDDAA